MTAQMSPNTITRLRCWMRKRRWRWIQHPKADRRYRERYIQEYRKLMDGAHLNEFDCRSM